MVYTPKVWDNEVITDVALNHIEVGVEGAYKTSEAVVDSNVDLGTYTHKAARHLSTYKYLIANSGTTDAFLDTTVYNVSSSKSHSKVLVTIPSNVILGSTISCSVTGRRTSGDGAVTFMINLYRGGVLIDSFPPSLIYFTLDVEETKHFDITGIIGGDILKMTADAANAVGYIKDISFNAVEISGSNPEAWP